MKFLKILLVILGIIVSVDLGYTAVRKIFPETFGYEFYSGTVLSVGDCQHVGGPSDSPEYRQIVAIQTVEGHNLNYSVYCGRFQVGNQANFLVGKSGAVVDDDRNFASTKMGSIILFIVSVIPILLVIWFFQRIA